MNYKRASAGSKLLIAICDLRFALCDLDLARKQIINVESGSFAKAPRGTIDLQLDKSTIEPGRYTFEKMFSGGCLGTLSLKSLQKAGQQGLLCEPVTEKLLAIENPDTEDVNSFMHYPTIDSNPLAALCNNGLEQDRVAVWHLLDSLNQCL